ncbi:hypothetical protein QQS21_005996 [Conoideocrella luteorostrata]|uniref:methylenetetrahydrofolate dehydrogenase (NADP(+)) n=1 Tax=Conoideocrella luteorostrata TaxID=1105319 RepID=A0AAJ0FTA6_9HYPO|nr:hypothetical protein QQS21_005996 [Conoideocrella luteorostrata]
MPASLLKGDLVVNDIHRWCLRKGHKDGVEPVLAVVFFNTDPAAEDYVRIKAHVAAKANVGYWVYEMPPNASSAEVKAQIRDMNRNPQIHGILIQRPLPEQLDEPKIMATISPVKHIEENSADQKSNIAADAFTRLLTKYGKRRLANRSMIHIAGFGNIITDDFIAHMARQYPFVSATPDLPTGKSNVQNGAKHDVNNKTAVLVTELHQGPGCITRDKIPPDVKVIIDAGFYSTEKGTIVGDVDHKAYQDSGLAIAPTPGGLLPILLWLMMERTIRAKRVLKHRESISCCACQ